MRDEASKRAYGSAEARRAMGLNPSPVLQPPFNGVTRLQTQCARLWDLVDKLGNSTNTNVNEAKRGLMHFCEHAVRALEATEGETSAKRDGAADSLAQSKKLREMFAPKNTDKTPEQDEIDKKAKVDKVVQEVVAQKVSEGDKGAVMGGLMLQMIVDHVHDERMARLKAERKLRDAEGSEPDSPA